MAGRGRPPGAKNKPKGEAPAGTTEKAAKAAGLKVVGGTETIARAAGDPKSVLTNQEGNALFLSNVAKYEKVLAVKKKADADLKNSCKAIRQDHGEHAINMIKLAIKLREPDGRAELEAELARSREVAIWMGVPLGHQGDLFARDRRTAEERANTEGFQAGAAGEGCNVPKHFGDVASKPGAAWVSGWEAGQRALVDIKTKRGAPLLRAAEEPPGPNDGEPDPDPEDGDGEPDEGEDGEDVDGEGEDTGDVVPPVQGLAEGDGGAEARH